MAYTCYVLTQNSRNNILKLFKPKYPNVICHHITEKFGVPENTPPPKIPSSVQIVGYINSNNGVEGLLVAIDGSIDRPDGSKYHITLSLNENKKPVETNDYVNDSEPITPISIMVTPKTIK